MKELVPEPAYAASNLSASAELLDDSSSEVIRPADPERSGSDLSRQRRPPSDPGCKICSRTTKSKDTIRPAAVTVPKRAAAAVRGVLPDHLRFGARRSISPDSVNTNTSSPVTVLMSWCMLTHRRSVDSCTKASICGREVSSR